MVRPILAAALAPLLVSTLQFAAAQQTKAPAAAAPVSTEPATTSASYGDWVYRCQRVGDGDKARRICEVAHVVQAQNQANPVAEIALGRLPGEASLHLTAVLPVNVSFPSIVELGLTDKSHAQQLQWRRCLPGGCFADTVATDDAVKAWRVAAAPGRLTFKDASGRDVAMPISFRGLAQALDALGRS